jgi:signal transduction histidine kinase/ActR/RegA family two-component response regulator
MKLLPAVAAFPLLLLLLTWLLLRGMNSDALLFDQTLAALDDFSMAEAALRRDVLSARAGLLHNYDPLVREVNALNDALVRLQDVQAGHPRTVAPIRQLAASVARQEGLTESFKSDNALLQNSLAYFGLFSIQLGASDINGPIFPAVSALGASMLHLKLDTSPTVAREVADRLDALAAQSFPAGDTAALQWLLAHGRMLRDLLPVTDRLVKALIALPHYEDQDAVRRVVLVEQLMSRERAAKYRLLLYAASLVLLAILVQLGLRLRGRARSLRRRAAMEHVIAAISTRFINARPHELGGHIEQALAQLAAGVGADRAYFLLPGNPSRVHGWHRDGAAFPQGWPQGVPALLARFTPTPEGIIHIPRLDRLPAGAGRAALAAAGLTGWVCVPGGPGVGALLGFDALGAGIDRPSEELGLLRMALDAIANAVGREILERDRARLETSLQQARRMETIGALASGIAHNFNNIVGAILGYAEMAEAQVAADSPPGRHLGEIRRAGGRARQLIDQILAFGRRRDIRRLAVNVPALIGETTSMLRASLPPEIELVVHGTQEPAVIYGEAGLLQQVIINLCNNAAEAMSGMGRIELDAVVCRVEQPRTLSHGELAAGLYARISVSDSGRGMDSAIIERIFEPFFTTRVAGHGLGLATVREIVREHGGAMNVSSTPGAGSRFEAWLPCSPGGACPAPGREDSSLPFGHGETLLMVEDDRAQLTRDEEMLAALGYEPVGFTHPAGAQAALRADPGRFDAVVLRQSAPLSAALDLAAALHQIAPDLPILLTTAAAEEMDAEALMAVGISEIIRRPFMSIEIAEALSRCLELRRRAPAALEA